MRREHYDRDVGLDLLEALEGLDAIHAGHGEIEQYQSGIVDAEHANGFFARRGNADLKISAHQVRT